MKLVIFGLTISSSWGMVTPRSGAACAGLRRAGIIGWFCSNATCRTTRRTAICTRCPEANRCSIPEDVLGALALSKDELQRIPRRARTRTLEEHTAERRACQFEEILAGKAERASEPRPAPLCCTEA